MEIRTTNLFKHLQGLHPHVYSDLKKKPNNYLLAIKVVHLAAKISKNVYQVARNKPVN